MITAVDTNVFSILWSGGSAGTRAKALLGEAHAEGGLVLSPIVYAEMLANPLLQEGALGAMLAEAKVRVEYGLLPSVWQEAGVRFGHYAARRQRSGGGEPRRLLADFVVGAHALVQADQLLTFDVGRYRTSFPELKLMNTRAALYTDSVHKP